MAGELIACCPPVGLVVSVWKQLSGFAPTGVRRGARHLLSILGIGRGRDVYRAQRATARERWDEAARDWAEVVTGRDSSQIRPEWFAHLAWAHYMAGDHDEARRAQQQALDLEPSHAMWWHRSALIAQRQGDWAGVAAAYERALELDDEELEWHARLGYALERVGRVDEAQVRYETALQQSERPPRLLYTHLGNLLRRRGRYEEAERLAGRGLHAFPDSIKIARLRATLAMDRRDWPVAIDRWDRVREVGGGSLRARDVFARGRALQALGRFDEALACFDEALERLDVVDEPWAFEALSEWEFRWEYCYVRTGPSDRQHRALDVEVQPDVGIEGTPTDLSGRFSAEVIHTGLLLTGWVADPRANEVSLHLDGREFKRVDLQRDEVGWRIDRPTFRFALKHPTLDHFPQTFRLSVRVNGQPLISGGGAAAITVTVPHGDGDFLQHGALSSLLTKKGTLAGTVGPDVSGAISAMESYATARSLFERRYGRSLVLLYGTLLGCVRDGDFIAGDDDVDVGFISDARDPTSVKRDALTIAEDLRAAGYDVGIRVSGGLFKLYIQDRELDVYPIWFASGRTWAYSDIDARREDFEPFREDVFKGTQVLLPGNPEAVLAGTYGADWRVPRPSFRHYRPLDVRRTLAQTYLTPAEARAIRLRSQPDRESATPTGRFLIGHSPDRPAIVPQRFELRREPRSDGLGEGATAPPRTTASALRLHSGA